MNKYDVIKKYIDEFDYYGLLASCAPNDEFDSYSQMLSQRIAQLRRLQELLLKQWIKLLQKK